jgi:hypothetical protein
VSCREILLIAPKLTTRHRNSSTAFSPSTNASETMDNFSPSSIGSMAPGGRANGIISTLASKRPPALNFKGDTKSSAAGAGKGGTKRSALRSPALGNFMDLDNSADESSMSGGELRSPNLQTQFNRRRDGIYGAAANGIGGPSKSPTHSPIAESAPKSSVSSFTAPVDAGADLLRSGSKSKQPAKFPPLQPLTFTRQPLPPKNAPQPKSLLSSLISSQTESSDNPYSSLYASVAARRGVDSYTLTVFFPFAKAPHSVEPIELSVHRDSSVEECIGFGLWKYWESGWEPKLDATADSLGGKGKRKADDMGEEERKVRFSAIGWSMRIAEEDGEVDEDFPREYTF